MSTWLKKTKGVPGSAPGGYEWPDTETVVEVHDDALAADLLEIPDAGFVTVPAPEPQRAEEHGASQEPDTSEQKDGEGAADSAGGAGDAKGGADAEAKPARARKTTAAKAAQSPAE